MTGESSLKSQELKTYSTGYGAALLLTCIAFGVVYWHAFSPDWTVGIVFGLALVQIIVHFRLFLHISLKRSARQDLLLVLFSTLIVLLMVGGTLVLLFNQRARMM